MLVDLIIENNKFLKVDKTIMLTGIVLLKMHILNFLMEEYLCGPRIPSDVV